MSQASRHACTYYIAREVQHSDAVNSFPLLELQPGLCLLALAH